MAARILMEVAVLMALYGCGQSPETKDSFQGVEPLDPEASAFSTVVLTGQTVSWSPTWWSKQTGTIGARPTPT